MGSWILASEKIDGLALVFSYKYKVQT